MVEKRKRLLSGVKPSGRPHIGNYFGAMRQFVSLAKEHESIVFIANYHALNTVQHAAELRELTLDVMLDYLAIGLDPKETLFFAQSDVPEHTELCWIFNTITTMPFLMRAHAFKDAEAKNKEICVGTFDYPLLMAADILLYEPDIVPVGQDQKQHIEITRDTAQKFNTIFGETFKLPEAYIEKNTAIVPGIDGQKMSKSYGNTIGLFAEDEDIEKQVMAIVTDSKAKGEPLDPATCNIFALHKLVSVAMLPELERRYLAGEIGYKESKELLMENLKKYIAPLREKRRAVLEDTEGALSLLKEGSARAREIASAKMKEVREKIGAAL